MPQLGGHFQSWRTTMTRSDSIAALSAALAAAQGEMRNVAKDSVNTDVKSKFSSLAAIIDAAKQPLSKNGLSIIQAPTFTYYPDGRSSVAVTTFLSHSSGEYVFEELTLPCASSEPWAVASLVSYIRRYSYSSFVGLASEDDDGAGAMKAVKEAHAKVVKDLKAAAAGGMDSLTAAFKELTVEQRAAVSSEVPSLKEQAQKVGAQ